MGSTFSKREVKDAGEFEKLIAEHAESAEPGLRIIDSRLRVGYAAIDLVGVDSNESLVLIALGLAADDAMLLRAVDAYSWCLEYPDTVRRLYPKTRILVGRPPRVLFVAERIPDAFLRKVRQLVLPEVDCLKCVPLEVNGSSAAYFEVVERIRRASAPAAPVDSPPQPSAAAIAQAKPVEATAPPEKLIRANGNGIHKARLAEAARHLVSAKSPSAPAASPAAPKAEWRELLAKLGAGAAAESLGRPNGNGDAKGEPVEAVKRLVSANPASAPAASPAAPKTPWQEFLNRLEAEAPVTATAAVSDPAPAEPDPVEVAAPAESPAEPLETETAAASPAAPESEWQEFLNKIETGTPVETVAAVPETAPAEPEPVEVAAPAESPAEPAEASAAGGDDLEEYRDAWQELLDQLGTLHLPKNGELSREWREFLNQLKTTE